MRSMLLTALLLSSCSAAPSGYICVQEEFLAGEPADAELQAPELTPKQYPVMAWQRRTRL